MKVVLADWYERTIRMLMSLRFHSIQKRYFQTSVYTYRSTFYFHTSHATC